MANSLNRVILVGNLGKDAETRVTASQVNVTNFSIATSRRFKDTAGEFKEETDWHKVVAWRLSDKFTPLLTKGSRVCVEGRLQTRSYDDKEGKKVYSTEVVADDVILLTSGKGGAAVEEDIPF